MAAPVKTRGGTGFKVLEPAPLEERLTVAQVEVRRAVTLLQDALEAIERGDARARRRCASKPPLVCSTRRGGR
jgi:hypothetical protein